MCPKRMKKDIFLADQARKRCTNLRNGVFRPLLHNFEAIGKYFTTSSSSRQSVDEIVKFINDDVSIAVANLGNGGMWQHFKSIFKFDLVRYDLRWTFQFREPSSGKTSNICEKLDCAHSKIDENFPHPVNFSRTQSNFKQNKKPHSGWVSGQLKHQKSSLTWPL